MDRVDILAGLADSIALGGPLKKTRGTPVMPGCLSARLRPDEEGLPLPYDSNMHQRRRRSRAGQLKLIQ
jgi:hypothetical protein